MDTPHTFLSGGEDCVVYSIDVRQPKAAHKLLINKKETGNKVKVHCVAADPTNDNLFCTAGGDPYLRIYDRRKVSKAESKPLKTFCPHHLVRTKKL